MVAGASPATVAPSAAVTPPRVERFASPAEYTPKHLADKILTAIAAAT